MKKLIGDIIELVISIISLIALAILFVLVITFHKYLFLLGSIYAAINVAKMWDNISNYYKSIKNI